MCHKVVLVDATSWIAQSVTLSTIPLTTWKCQKKLETDWIHIDFHHFPVCSHPLSSRCPFCFLVPMAQTPIWKWPNSNQQLQLRDRFSKAYSPLSSSFPRTGIRNIPGVRHPPLSSFPRRTGIRNIPGTRLQAGLERSVLQSSVYASFREQKTGFSPKCVSFLQSYILLYNHLYSYIHIYILTK